jgi:hypothetical protein
LILNICTWFSDSIRRSSVPSRSYRLLKMKKNGTE